MSAVQSVKLERESCCFEGGVYCSRKAVHAILKLGYSFTPTWQFSERPKELQHVVQSWGFLLAREQTGLGFRGGCDLGAKSWKGRKYCVDGNIPPLFWGATVLFVS